jgi:CRP-like cAMP-binding protein
MATQVREYNSAEFIGGLSLLGETKRLFSLKAVSDTTCLVLNREKFSKTIEQFPHLLVKICNAVAKSIDLWEERFLSDRADQCGECLSQLGVTLI